MTRIKANIDYRGVKLTSYDIDKGTVRGGATLDMVRMTELDLYKFPEDSRKRIEAMIPQLKPKSIKVSRTSPGQYNIGLMVTVTGEVEVLRDDLVYEIKEVERLYGINKKKSDEITKKIRSLEDEISKLEDEKWDIRANKYNRLEA